MKIEALPKLVMETGKFACIGNKQKFTETTRLCKLWYYGISKCCYGKQKKN